eukprot:CAMPEP_0172579578 /NCGR_PEP_ID=MMETSP1067-20121228/139320_1 /TAXON_ID=265564 ORGANISM="Thalassiosira punctigera, Strain Tpunct2005C2" /NCGR_SAMPLE_ID=MMETSP1067 /ASSEMBLY_ACC=CAM_ASM_000444 /LENGTH=131 /DNA_ID=CAMNT_0013372301 /DNA_START=87 /DNA_END=487 /DNA_ORIENTATION=+
MEDAPKKLEVAINPSEDDNDDGKGIDRESSGTGEEKEDSMAGLLPMEGDGENGEVVPIGIAISEEDATADDDELERNSFIAIHRNIVVGGSAGARERTADGGGNGGGHDEVKLGGDARILEGEDAVVVVAV